MRRKIEQYVKDKIRGRYGHSKQRTQLFGDQFEPTKAKARRGYRRVPLHQAPPLTPSAESVEFEPGAADHQIPLEIHKLGLSDNQLEVIMRTAELLAEEKCQEFLQRVAVILAVRGQFNDNDVSVAVHRALGDMIRN